MAVLSKPAKFKWFTPLPYTCHEFLHTWDPSCVGSHKFVATQAVKSMLKIYSVLYGFKLVWHLIKGRKDKRKILKTYITDVLQSTIFMSINSTAFMVVICAMRQALGNIYGEFGFISGLFSGFVALPFEKENRRIVLANYIGNLGIETVYNMMVSRQMIKPIRNIETIVFSTSIGFLLGLYRMDSPIPPSLKSNISFVLSQDDSIVFKYLSVFPKFAKVFNQLCNIGPKHVSCEHESACFQHALKGGINNFLFGFVADLVLNTNSMYRWLINGDQVSLQFQLCKFVGCFNLLYRLSDCLIKHLFEKSCPKVIHFLPGAIAGISLKFYQSKTIAIFALMKSIQIMYRTTVDNDKMYEIPHIVHIVYSTSFAVLLHALIYEPHNIRPSYYRFMCRITRGKFSNVFRKLLDEYGTHASHIDPDFIPNLSVANVSSPKVLQLIQQRKL